MYPSDPGLLVLHTVRLVGFVDAPVVAERLALSIDEVTEHLTNATADGFARRRDGSRAGWSLTDEGRKENERLLADEIDHAGHRSAIEGAHRRFVPLNGRLLELCTDWQVRDRASGRLNDHDDPAYDRAIVERLVALDAEAKPLLDEMGARLERFSGYGRRLADALARVRNGEREWLTRPTIDSYHTVWFELHEDLLATLGLERSSEAGATTKEA